MRRSRFIFLEQSHRCEDGCQRCAQLVTENSEEIIFRIIGRLGRFFCSTEFLFIQLGCSNIHADSAHSNSRAGGVIEGAPARSHVSNGAVYINNPKTDIVIGLLHKCVARGSRQLGSILGMHKSFKGFHRPVELCFGSAEKGVHMIVPGDPASDEIPIPCPGLRSFQSKTQAFFASAQSGIALTDRDEHLVERFCQLSDLIVTVFHAADGIILPV